MCLISIKKSKIFSPGSKDLSTIWETATKNITVYKRFEYYENCQGRIIFESPYQSMEYHLGQTYETNMVGTQRLGGDFIVDDGFHSYMTEKRAPGNAWGYEIVIPCIIPKGAKYIKGTGNEIVSNKIILPRKFEYKGYTYYIPKT